MWAPATEGASGATGYREMRYELRRILAMAVVTALMLALSAMPALAQPQQSGLVNVNIQDVANNNVITLQLPVAVAANVCDTTVAALNAQFEENDSAECNAAAGSRAQNNR